MEATETITLYRPEDVSIIGEVYAGEQYYVGIGVEVYVGTLENFLTEHPEYNTTEE